MVAGKVKVAMGLQKSPASRKAESTPKPSTPAQASPSSGKVSQKTVFSRSFGVYFPRSSAQVQPRPPDVTELLRVVEELRDREARLKTDLLEHKLLKESVAIVPMLENEISTKDAEVERASKRILFLEAENERLRVEMEEVTQSFEEQRREGQERIKAMEGEITELKKMALDRSRMELILENDELSASQRFQGLMEVSEKSNLIRNLKRATKCSDAVVNQHNRKVEQPEAKNDEVVTEGPRHSRCNSEEPAESTLCNVKSRIPRVPKPPKPSSSPYSFATTSSSSSTVSSGDVEKAIPAPPPVPTKQMQPPSKSAPPPPPPPPPPKGKTPMPAKVRRIPEVVEFYHSLMRRDSRRDLGSGVMDPPSTAKARDMIGEIENRSAHLLAVSHRSCTLCLLNFLSYVIYNNVTRRSFLSVRVDWFSIVFIKCPYWFSLDFYCQNRNITVFLHILSFLSLSLKIFAFLSFQVEMFTQFVAFWKLINSNLLFLFYLLLF